MVVTAWLAGENLIMRDRQLPSFESYARLLKTIYLWRDSYGHHRQYSEGFGYRLGIARHAQGRHARTGANYCDRKAGARHGRGCLRANQQCEAISEKEKVSSRSAKRPISKLSM